MFILFDLDSTLCSIEWCDRLAARQGVGRHVAELTKATMDGTRSFDEVFISKTKLISPSRDDLETLGKEYISTLTPGIADLVKKLQTAGHSVGILSQGYREAACIVAKELGIKECDVHALIFDHDADGNYAWFPEQALKYENGKTVTIRELKKRFPEETIVFIGDSVGDMIAWDQADMFIGCGIHVLREKAQQWSKYFASTLEELQQFLVPIS